MERLQALGAALSAVALVGYVAGIWLAYPGRALSVSAFMLGATLVAIGGGE